jgi:hypothetical protein
VVKLERGRNCERATLLHRIVPEAVVVFRDVATSTRARPGPSQTRSARWNRRPIVERYRAWSDEIHLVCTGSPPPEDRGRDRDRHLCLLPPTGPGVLARFGEDKAVVIMQGVKFYAEKGDAPRADVFLRMLQGRSVIFQASGLAG